MIGDLAVLGVASAVLVAARVRGWLTRPGAASAAAVGVMVWAGAGAGGVGLLLLFFVTSGALTVLRRPPRGSSAPVRRTARQVWANGGVAALCGVAAAAGVPGAAVPALVGSLSAATADTWASEVGRMAGRRPRDPLSGRVVAVGTPGGTSWPGTAAGLAGAACLGGAAQLWLGGGLGWLVVGLAGGLAGATADTLAGAALEARRGWISSDGVNVVGTVAGAATGWLVAGIG